MIIIENDRFLAGILSKGAELCSFKNKSTGQEMIWQADPEVWPGSAPILFPLVGRLANDETKIKGKPYRMPKHGLLRQSEARLIEQGSDFAVLGFFANAETLVQYPYAFEFRVVFRLVGNGLEVRYAILNAGAEEMLFAVGSHPAFALNLRQYKLSDYYVEFSEPETLDLLGMVGGSCIRVEENYLANESRIPLSETLFDGDALIFDSIQSNCVRLKNRHEDTYLEVDTFGAPHLGLWAKSGAAFVCIEPWYSYDAAIDAGGEFADKPGVMRLPAGETFETGYSINVVG
jgi:galactose mutarotase-like enzyme